MAVLFFKTLNSVEENVGEKESKWSKDNMTVRDRWRHKPQPAIVVIACVWVGDTAWVER